MRILFFLIFTVPLITFSQPEKPKRRLSAIGMVFSPDYSYRSLNFSSSNQWVAKIKNDEEVGNTGFTVGFQMHYRLGSKMKFETGLLYANKSFQTKYKDLAWVSDEPLLPDKSKTIYRFKYLTLPAGISYSFFNSDKVNFFAATGISVNFFLSHKTKVVMDRNGDRSIHASSKQTGYSKFNLSGRLGLGIDYHFSKKLMTRAELFYQRSINSIVANRDADTYLYSFGIAAGVYYSL